MGRVFVWRVVVGVGIILRGVIVFLFGFGYLGEWNDFLVLWVVFFNVWLYRGVSVSWVFEVFGLVCDVDEM